MWKQWWRVEFSDEQSCVYFYFFAVCMGKNETITLNLYSKWVNYNRFAANGYVLN